MTLPIGHVLHNRYRIAHLVGQGGFGAVYRAWDQSLSQTVALKENMDRGIESQRRFEREAKLLAGLRHPNLPRVIDHFILPSQGQYLVMDFVEGQSLAQMLRQRGRPLEEREARDWLRQVCHTVQYLHSHTPPIIHRDIKPDNIIVTAAGRAMLVDFGISKLYDAGRGTSTGTKAITPGYSPPEQYGIGKTDARSDVYALGATLYTLLTGQVPPEAVDLVSGTETLRPPRQLNPAISQAAEQAIAAAMTPSVSQRVESVGRFEQLLTSGTVVFPSSGTPPIGSSPSARSTGRTVLPKPSPGLPTSSRSSLPPTIHYPTQMVQKPRRWEHLVGGVAIAALTLVLFGVLVYAVLALLNDDTSGILVAEQPPVGEATVTTTATPPTPAVTLTLPPASSPAAVADTPPTVATPSIEAATTAPIIAPPTTAPVIAPPTSAPVIAPPTTVPPTITPIPPPTITPTTITPEDVPSITIPLPPDFSQAGYAEYVTIYDDSRAISVGVPAEWAAINGSNWKDDAGTVLGSQLIAAPNLDGFLNTYAVPGVLIQANASFGNITTSALADRFDFSSHCVYDGQFPFANAFESYTGVYNRYINCDGQSTVVIVVGAHPPAWEFNHGVTVLVKVVTRADGEALDNVLNTFSVGPQLPGQ